MIHSGVCSWLITKRLLPTSSLKNNKIQRHLLKNVAKGSTTVNQRLQTRSVQDSKILWSVPWPLTHQASSKPGLNWKTTRKWGTLFKTSKLSLRAKFWAAFAISQRQNWRHSQILIRTYKKRSNRKSKRSRARQNHLLRNKLIFE